MLANWVPRALGLGGCQKGLWVPRANWVPWALVPKQKLMSLGYLGLGFSVWLGPWVSRGQLNPWGPGPEPKQKPMGLGYLGLGSRSVWLCSWVPKGQLGP